MPPPRINKLQFAATVHLSDANTVPLGLANLCNGVLSGLTNTQERSWYYIQMETDKWYGILTRPIFDAMRNDQKRIEIAFNEEHIRACIIPTHKKFLLMRSDAIIAEWQMRKQ